MTNVDPTELDSILSGMRAGVLAEFETLPEVLLDVQALRAALPAETWEQYFGDFPKPKSPDDASQRRMSGTVEVSHAGAAVNLEVNLRCDPVARPNKMGLEWNGHHFDLDLITGVNCGDPSTPMTLYHGTGIGRWDGHAGALVEWRLSDFGEPGGVGDHVQIAIHSDTGDSLLDVDSGIDEGNLQAHGR